MTDTPHQIYTSEQHLAAKRKILPHIHKVTASIDNDILSVDGLRSGG
jgi:hypothetical protein